MFHGTSTNVCNGNILLEPSIQKFSGHPKFELGRIWILGVNFADFSTNSMEIGRIAKFGPGRIHRILLNSAEFWNPTRAPRPFTLYCRCCLLMLIDLFQNVPWKFTVNTRAIINYLNVNKNVDTYNTRKVKVFPSRVPFFIQRVIFKILGKWKFSLVLSKFPARNTLQSYWSYRLLLGASYLHTNGGDRQSAGTYLWVHLCFVLLSVPYPSMAGAGAVPCVHDGTGNASSNGTASSGSGLC
jgi:hypothetical protein